MLKETCGGCGTENPEGARFCAMCGAAIGARSAPRGVHPSYGVPVSSGELLGFGALAVLMPGIGTIISYVMAGLWISRRRPGGTGFLTFAIIYPFFVLLFVAPALIAMPNYIRVKNLAMEAEVKSNFHNIQLSVERYAVDHDGEYPSDINELITLGYIGEFPRNPLSPRNESGMTSRKYMRPVADGNYSAGDFVYLPRISPEGKVTGYELKLYGSLENRGFIEKLSGGE